MYPGTCRTPVPSTPLLPFGPSALEEAWARPRTGGTASQAPSLAGTVSKSSAGHGEFGSQAATTLGGRSKSATALSSKRSGASAQSIRDSQRLSILKAVKREEEAGLHEFQEKNLARSSLTDYFRQKQDMKDRARQKSFEMPMHLRTGGMSSTDMGCPIQYETQQTRVAKVPIAMSVDPFWSTDLKKLNDKIGARLKYNRFLSASCQGSISPELHHMGPKLFLSKPPTPYFVPGKGNS
ncbi:unnamed protein product [Polarella glacialis]|uniref:Uncharacterized protein n=1 Tax=Polarella glacialis TaxID=89957 RepID=A0A813HDC4_POLGL|nr:unnamed protein product [Polarella glacialis]